LLAYPSCPRWTAKDKKRHISAQPGSEGKEVTSITPKAEEPIKAKQRSRRIAAAPTQTCPNWDSLSDMDPNRTTKPLFPEQHRCGPISDVRPSLRDLRVIACDCQVLPSQSWSGDLKLIIEIDGNHQAIDEMIAVLPHPYYSQEKIDLGRRKHLHIPSGNTAHGRLPVEKNDPQILH
jgi:hypothetical protein